MADTIDPKFLDKRTSPRYLTSGQLDEKLYDRHMKGLPDLQEKSIVVETMMDDEDFDDDDDDDFDDEDEADAAPADGPEPTPSEG